MEPDEKKLDRLVKAVESLQERMEGSTGRGAGRGGPSARDISLDDYRELLESRVRRGIFRNVLLGSVLVMVLLVAAAGVGGWLWLDNAIDRKIDLLVRDIREREVPRAIRDQVAERLSAAVQEESKNLTENFRKEVREARWALADRYLSSGSKHQQIQGLQILRESDDPRAVDRVLKFMREKGPLEPLALSLRRLNLDYGIQALLARGSDEAQSALRQIIADPGYASGVRADALLAAAILRDRRALPAVRAALADVDPVVRQGALEAVVALDARASWPYLVGLLAEGKDPKGYPDVIDALTKLEVAQAAEAVQNAVRRALANPADLFLHKETLSKAVDYFRSMKTQSALPLLFDLLMHPDPDFRLQTVAAVRELTGKSLGTLEEWKEGDAGWRAVKIAEWRSLADGQASLPQESGESGRPAADANPPMPSAVPAGAAPPAEAAPAIPSVSPPPAPPASDASP